MYIRIRGQRWRLVFENQNEAYGTCDHDSRTIAIDPRCSTADMLDTIVHEALHACLPDLAEESVSETAGDIVALISNPKIGGILAGRGCSR